MSTATTTAAAAAPGSTLARPAGFAADVWHLAVRETRNAMKQPFLLVSALIVPIFFYFVNLGALGTATQFFDVGNPESFFLPVGLLFAVSNGGAGLSLVEDIERGYFDKLLLTPVSRIALIIGSMGASVFRIFLQAVLVMLIGWATGATFGLGVPGAIGLLLVACLWGLAYDAIGYGIALQTGSSQATQSAFILFFPFAFLTTSFLPEEALSGWLATAAMYNPVTYLLAGMRSLLGDTFDVQALLEALGAIAAVGTLTLTWALTALRRRVR